MKWKTASLFLLLASCGEPLPKIMVDLQEGPTPTVEKDESKEEEVKAGTKTPAEESKSEEPEAKEESKTVEPTEANPVEDSVEDSASPKPTEPTEPAEPQDVVAAQEEQILQHQEQLQVMEDELLEVYVEVLKGKCIKSGGTENVCAEGARQEVHHRYHAAEEAVGVPSEDRRPHQTEPVVDEKSDP